MIIIMSKNKYVKRCLLCSHVDWDEYGKDTKTRHGAPSNEIIEEVDGEEELERAGPDLVHSCTIFLCCLDGYAAWMVMIHTEI